MSETYYGDRNLSEDLGDRNLPEDTAQRHKSIISVGTRISLGHFDEELDEILREVTERRRLLQLRAGHALKPGDKVRFTSGRPRYLIGHTATVTKVMQTYVSLKLDVGVGKFPANCEVRTPMSIITKV